MRIARATESAQLLAAARLFDDPPREEWAVDFLAAPGHHLFLAYEDGDPGDTPVGFVSGVETLHPDKGREMFLYELSVDEEHRRRGIGRALVRTLADLASELGCYDMWVPVDMDNDPARATYLSAGGKDDGPCRTLTWDLRK
ncbi:GNAT family N-acetyltransferase [Streptomyces sp. NPDC052225]|uniref:GNAT family N-acetyltransferase n=1 Tax=Streptomyces sp. NPDC052225 TaxID=3154949 RepID=UPI0034316481